MDEQNVWRHGRTLITSLTLGTIALIATARIYYSRQRDGTEAAAKQDLEAILQIKAEQILNWRRERLGHGRALEIPAVMRLARQALSGKGIQAGDRDDLLDVMRKVEQEFLYTGAALVDRRGVIRLKWDLAPSDPDRIAELGRAASSLTDITLQDLYWDVKLQRPLMALLVPVQGSGAFIFTIDPERFLYPLIRSWPVPSRTAETVLVRLEGNTVLFLNNLRHMHEAALHYRRSLRDFGEPETLKRLLHASIDDVPDYRGVRVLRIAQKIPDSPWYLVAKIDISEVDAPVWRLGWEMAAMVALIALANGAGAGYIWRNRQIRIYREREEWLREVLNKTPAYLWMADAAGNNTFINKPLADFLGTTAEQLGQNWPTYYYPEDVERVTDKFFRCVGLRCESTDQARIRRYDGEYRWFMGTARPRFSSSGQFLGYAGSLLDITERMLAEQKLQATHVALQQELKERARKETEIQALSARLMNAQEEERGRIARELHDDLSQQIAALSLALSNLKRVIPAEAAEARSQSEWIRDRLSHLAEAIRRLSHELHPAILEYSGLEPALRAYCSELATLTGIQVDFRSDGSFADLPPPVRLCAYRITQEALRNVAKHAGTDQAEVRLTSSENAVKLTVSDHGLGMDLTGRNSFVGLGLTSIRERARLVNGKVDIQSEPGCGTTLSLTVPLAGWLQTAKRAGHF